MLRPQGWPRDSGVGDDYPIDSILNRDADDLVGLAFAEIGSDLQKDRRAIAWPRLAHRRQQRAQRAPVLELPQARGVGRADIDGQVARDRAHRAHALRIVDDPVRAILVGADIDADDAPRMNAMAQAQPSLGLALVIETQTVDHRPIPAEAKHPRLRIARLRER